MADQYQVLEGVLDQELAGLKREMMAQARQELVLSKNEYGNLVGSVEVNLDAVLRSAASTRIVRQVLEAQGEEDNPSAEEARVEESTEAK